MTTKKPTKSLLPAIKAFISNAWIIKQKKLAVTGTLAFCASASTSYGEFVIHKDDFAETKRTAQAARFLSQATMGADLAQIDRFAVLIKDMGYYEACEWWLDYHFNKVDRETDMHDTAYNMWDADWRASGAAGIRYVDLAFWETMVNSPEDLRHRIAFSLSQIFVVSTDIFSEVRGQVWNNASHHYDILADGAFGSYRDLLHDVTYSPMMGVYLSSAQNDAGDPANGLFPDQNYGREVMQLFSTGVFSRWKNGSYEAPNGVRVENYDEDDIMEMAKIFTGLSKVNSSKNFAGFHSTPFSGTGYFIHPMQMRDAYHDMTAKVLPNGKVLPAGQSGDKDISDTLDYLADHRSTAPNMSIELIKRLTSSNPSNAYVKRVVVAWLESDGDLKEVIKAILLDPEVRDAVNYSVKSTSRNWGVFTATPVDSVSGRMNEDILKMSRFYTFYNATSTKNDDGTFRATSDAHSVDTTFGPRFLQAVSVFNFYDTYYAPGSGPIGDYRDDTNEDIVTPEMQVVGRDFINSFEASYMMTTDPVVGLNNGLWNSDTYLERLDHYSQYTSNINTFVNRLDLYLCNGKMPQSLNLALRAKLSSSGLTRAEQYGIIAGLVHNSAAYSISH